MKLSRLFYLVLILAIPIFGMAQTDTLETEVNSAIVDDSVSTVFQIEYERENDNYIYIDSLHPGEEFIYITEYEEEKNVLDRVITRLLKTSVDTNYITTNDFGLMIKPTINIFDSQSKFKWDSESYTLPNRCAISSDQITEFGIWLGYRTFGYCFSVSLQPVVKDESKRNTKFGFSYYGDAWGAEISLNKTQGNNLYFNRVETDITSSEFTISRWQINSYYAPLYRKFSYNAAFSYSMKQEKSAGSPLIGLSMNALKLYAKPTELPQLVENESVVFPSNIRYYSCNLNVGYAYNFVTKHKTLFHISALPYITLFKKTEVSLENTITDFKEPRFQWGFVERFSWIWQKENHLISLFETINSSNLIRSPLKVNDTVFTYGICYGFRAYKHHKPHKKKRILKRKAKTREQSYID